MSKFTWIIIVILAFIGGVILYNKVLFPAETVAPKGGGKGSARKMDVEAFIVKPQNIDNDIQASGTLLPNEEVELHAEVAGRITQLNIREGSPVSKGTLLVKLFDDDLQAQLKKLQAQQATAEKTVSRLKQLLNINGIGQQEYDNAQIDLNNIQADIDLTLAQISKTEIRAPFNGVIGLKSVSLGAYVAPGTIIASLQQINPLKIDFTIPEKYFSSIKPNEPISFTVDGSNSDFKGRVFAIEPRIDESTRSIRVRALVQNNDAKLFPGAFAKVDMGLKTVENALMVPTQCVIPDARTKKVILLKGGQAKFTPVETGIRNQSYIQITSGVEIGDTIVTTGLMYIKPDAPLGISKVSE